jgi:hypothetical protein
MCFAMTMKMSARTWRSKEAIESITPLWYKLRMIGVPIDGPTNHVFCDGNEDVCKEHGEA